MWAKQGRVIKAASRWHLQGMKLPPKSPLDSSILGKGTDEESDPKQELSSEKEPRGRRGGGERERARCIYTLAPAGHAVTAEEPAGQ